ncbi:MAG: hypothetical protein EOM21_13620 [Gammaproteobacteria bacterium]|nr:hypothetical protein [Gammaproteobacteria bacterium]
MAAACPAFGSTSEVTLYYAAEPESATADLADATMVWYQIPMTGESIDAALTSAVSEQITPQRSYAGSKLVQGEVTGSFNYEMQANTFFYDMLIAVLQADKTMTAEGTTNWAAAGTIKNGSAKHCLAFLKRVQVGTGTYDWYIFRGCQIGSLSAEIQPNALITGAVNVMGVKPQAPIEAAAKPAGWTLTDAPTKDLMSGVDSLQDFAISSGGTPTGVTMQNVSFTIENQLRQQPAVGLGHPFSAGIASGRLSVKFSGSAYYADATIFSAFLDDETLTIEGSLLDALGNGISFECGTVKVTAGSIPMASAPDQDLLISTEFQAFEDTTTGTISIKKVAA